MLATIRVLRVLVGLIAVWQILGLLPVLTNWLPQLERVPGGMWAIAFWKVLVLVISGGLYFWLGKIKKRIEGSGTSGSDGRIVIYLVVAVLVLSIVAAIALPAISHRDHAPEPSVITQTPSVQPVLQPAPIENEQAKLPENSHFEKPPTFESEGWTQESTGSNASGPWLEHDPPGTRYTRFADGTIYRFFPPGVRPNAEKANPFGLAESTDRPPQ